MLPILLPNHAWHNVFTTRLLTPAVKLHCGSLQTVPEAHSVPPSACPLPLSPSPLSFSPNSLSIYPSLPPFLLLSSPDLQGPAEHQHLQAVGLHGWGGYQPALPTGLFKMGLDLFNRFSSNAVQFAHIYLCRTVKKMILEWRSYWKIWFLTIKEAVVM